MTPRFATTAVWQQAELLMQPAFIRVIDNIRKRLEASTWRGSYRDVHVWPRGTTPEAKLRVKQLQHDLETANSEEAADIQHALDHLPSPYPGYELCLSHNDHEITVELWDLCYQICFENYQPDDDAANPPVQIDASLIDETGDVDWHRLDAKAQSIVGAIFDDLPGGQAEE